MGSSDVIITEVDTVTLATFEEGGDDEFICPYEYVVVDTSTVCRPPSPEFTVSEEEPIRFSDLLSQQMDSAFALLRQ